MTEAIHQRIASEIQARDAQVRAAVSLLDDGATVPFIARYRKEATGGLDDAQLRTLSERLLYLRELEQRRESIFASIGEQGKLTPELEAALRAADTKTRLEDLYLPYRPKRRTKAQIARERGLEPLANQLLADPTVAPDALAAQFVAPDREVPDTDSALDGARQILMERFAEDAELVGDLRAHVWEHALIRATVIESQRETGTKFSDYFDHHEPLQRVPSHRALAMLRARAEGVVSLDLVFDPQDSRLGDDHGGVCAARVCRRFDIRDEGRPADEWLVQSARLAWRQKIALHLETELLGRIRDSAEQEAIAVFAKNLHDLLLAAPAGPRVILGLDPGLRTGVKIAVVDRTGRVLATDTIYPHPPRSDWAGAHRKLARVVDEHAVDLISIGNGTGSRETDRLVGELLRRDSDRRVEKIVVSEAGASVYSASELATRELGDMDVSLRGAVSIARRVQDPLAELVKIEPKSIGVGQYQHDVNQKRLERALDGVVEDCVNAVGVDVNTASPALLSHVAGLNPTLASNIVEYRDGNGPFRHRRQLLKVGRLGPKAFEQAAGFLRIRDGDNPLDASAVHPEAYPVVERIAARTGRGVGELIGDSAFLRSLKPEDYVDAQFGVPTVTDILAELEKPGRDPRPEFATAKFQDGVETLEDLRPDMVLEGVVTNVANFGAFVDIGVHQDGLVHISQMSHDYVEDPRQVVKAGQVVKVKVLEVDLARKRVALTMRLAERAERRRDRDEPRAERGDERRRSSGRSRGDRRDRGPRERSAGGSGAQRPNEPDAQNAFARALENLKKKGDGRS